MILGDYHTHTRYSHGKGTILENVAQAAKMGIKQIAITDHGFKHGLHNVERIHWQRIKNEIAEANQKFPSVRTLLGMECNLLDSKGAMDVEKEDLQDIDILICGFHIFSRSTSVKEFFGFNIPVFLSGLVHKSQRKRLVANTDAYINAMQRYPIDFISHPGYAMQVDLKELAIAARHHGIYLEINGKRVSFSTKDAQVMQENGGQFIINSDAHQPHRVGEISVPTTFAKKAGIDLENVVNWNKLPVFQKTNRE